MIIFHDNKYGCEKLSLNVRENRVCGGRRTKTRGKNSVPGIPQLGAS
jgi:hypothetical protein